MAEVRRTRRGVLKTVQDNAPKAGGLFPIKKGSGVVKRKPSATENRKPSKVSRSLLENLTNQTSKIKLREDPERAAPKRCGRKVGVVATIKDATKKKNCKRTSGCKAITQCEEPMEVDKKLPTLLPAPRLVKVNPAPLPRGVIDIDCDDVGNPQAAAENINEIYAYMWQLEDTYRIPENFLCDSVVSLRMRSVLVNWMIEVHQQFSLLLETLHLTVEIVDRFLAAQASEVKHKQLQLVGVAAMLIASKYEEMFVPEVGDFVYITDNAFSVKDILAMELRILKALDFNLGKPLTINFLRRNSKAGMVEIKNHLLAKYILEECLTWYNVAHIKPSERSAAALLLSLKMIRPRANLSTLWTQNLAYYSGYTLDSLLSTAGDIAGLLLQVPTSKYKAAFTKYNCANKGHVSRIPGIRTDILEEFADGTFS